MRPAALLAALALLAGCAGPPAAQTQPLDGPMPLVTPPLLVVADGTYPFHEMSTSPTAPTVLEAYDIVTQTVANPCSWEGGAYFSNRAIPTPTGKQPVRNGTLRLSFDWTDEDYPFPTMVAGYRAPGMGEVVDSPRIGRGETIEVRIDVARPTGANDWSLYACINRSDENLGDATWQPGPFLGSFAVRAEFQGDPEPLVAEEAPAGPRTSRS